MDSNKDLQIFLEKCDNEHIIALVEMLKSIFSIKASHFKPYKKIEDIPESNTEPRKKLAAQIVYEMRYYGSNNIAYLTRKIFKNEPGINYQVIAYETALFLNKKLKKETKKDLIIPRVANVKDYEELIIESLLRIQFANKTEDEIAQILKEAGLDEEGIKSSVNFFLKTATVGTGIIAIVKILGKKVIKNLIKNILVGIITIYLGKKAAQELVEQLLKKIAQKTIAKVVSVIGWLTLAFDIIDLASPAKRITVPCVCYIAGIRVLDRLDKEI